MRVMLLAGLAVMGLGSGVALADLAPSPRPPRPQPGKADTGPKLGVMLEPYNDGTRKGLLVVGVTPGGPATKLTRDGQTWYLEKNVDVIFAINGKPVTTMVEYRRELEAAGSTPTISVYDKKAKKNFEYKAKLPEGRFQGMLDGPAEEAGDLESRPKYQQVVIGAALAAGLVSCGFLMRRKRGEAEVESGEVANSTK